MFENYNKKRSTYYVVENNGKIYGGAGISHLNEANYNICELQKMYFLPSIRGKGLGDQMIEKCLVFALDNKLPVTSMFCIMPSINCVAPPIANAEEGSSTNF